MIFEYGGCVQIKSIQLSLIKCKFVAFPFIANIFGFVSHWNFKFFLEIKTDCGLISTPDALREWRPDEVFINFANNTAYIIEKKFQSCAGSVDEKLPGCHFKKLEYEKLFHPLDFNVEFIYIFNDWFLDKRYRDTLDYIKKMGCHYFYNKIPLDFLGL